MHHTQVNHTYVQGREGGERVKDNLGEEERGKQ
jgi:hypothetical protein